MRSMEKTNIRYVTPEDVGELVDFVSIDVAFISLTKVLEPIWHLMKDGAQMVCLIKPQFEAGREKVGKKGVVRDLAVHKEVMEHVISYAKSLGFIIKGLDFSPIRGPEGNIEYLLYIQKMENRATTFSEEEWNEWQKTMDETIEAAQEHAVKHAEDISG
ncbi:hemolysin A [Roseburia sp. CAG:309]|nr:hemolysin A [Roseburia sp. CAG:309]